VAYAGVRLSKMAKHRIWVTTSLESADFLLGYKTIHFLLTGVAVAVLGWKTSEEEFGSLATLPYCLNLRMLWKIGRG
jgi:hypothetical protein